MHECQSVTTAYSLDTISDTSTLKVTESYSKRQYLFTLSTEYYYPETINKFKLHFSLDQSPRRKDHWTWHKYVKNATLTFSFYQAVSIMFKVSIMRVHSANVQTHFLEGLCCKVIQALTPLNLKGPHCAWTTTTENWDHFNPHDVYL